MICVSVADAKDLPAALKSGAEWIELRLDLMGGSPGEYLEQLPGGMLSIATCRPGEIPAEERRRLLTEALQAGADYLDIEIETTAEELGEWRQKITEAGKELIVSYHNFEETPLPEEIRAIIMAAFEKGADLVKLACMVKDEIDARNLLATHDFPGRKVILGMGEAGRIVRVTAPLLGSEFTFAAVGEGCETAPGQLTVRELQDIYTKISGQ